MAYFSFSNALASLFAPRNPSQQLSSRSLAMEGRGSQRTWALKINRTAAQQVLAMEGRGSQRTWALNNNRTAAQQVLAIPELVENILSWDAAGYKDEPREYDWAFPRSRFVRYALVNKLWFTEAMRFIWWTALSASRLSAIQTLPRHRLRVYLEYAVQMTLHNDPRPQGSSAQNKILRGLEFPSLRIVTVELRVGQRLLSLPEIRGPNVQELTLVIVPVPNKGGLALVDVRTQQRLARRLRKMFRRLRKVTIKYPFRASYVRREDVFNFFQFLEGAADVEVIPIDQ